MPRWTRLALAITLSSSALAIAGCPKQGDEDTTSPTRGRSKPEKLEPPPRNMPKPLPLPAKPSFAVHVGDPAQALTMLGELTGQTDLRGLLAELATSSHAGFDPLLARHVDLERPWSAAVVEGQLVVQLPIDRSRLPNVAQLLSGKPEVGDFGAVSLGGVASTVHVAMAWLDQPNAMLTLAGDERGLATGRELVRAYAEHPLFATIDGAELRKHVEQVPFTRVVVEGKHVGDVHVTIEGLEQVQGLEQITEGALTGLLDSPELVAGASSRYAAYQTTVKQMISEATRQVSKQNFLVRGVLEDMLKRYNTVLRSWNGRVMVGLGPKQHVVLAMGADDPKKAVGAIGSLIDNANENLSLARTFGVSVPKLRFKRNASTSASIAIHTLTVDKARSFLPPELDALVDDSGALRIAFGGSTRGGAVMIAVGPDAAGALSRWLDHTKSSTTAAQSTTHRLAVTLAAEAATLLRLQSAQTLEPVLALSPERAPSRVVVTRKGEAYDVHVTGPVPKVDAQRIAPAAIVRPGVDPRTRAPARGVPPGRPAAAPRPRG